MQLHGTKFTGFKLIGTSTHTLVMASRQSVASYTLERPIPKWAARAASNAASRTDAVRLHDAEPMEFILTSNWVLQTEGIKDFYEVLHKRDENLEIEYDALLHGFRVKCLSHNEVKIVALVKEILDQLVRRETENGLVSSIQLFISVFDNHLMKLQDLSDKIINLEDWRKKKSQTMEKLEVPDKYAFPRDVAACNIRSTWKMSENLIKKSTTSSRMLTENVLSKLQELTSTVLITSSDGRTVYIGASGVEKVKKAKKKLDTLTQFFSLIPRDMTPVIKIFLYNEGDRSIMGEYRYVKDGNDRLLRSYILDRFDWPRTDQRYPTLFQKSVIVRLNPNNEPWEEARSLSNTVLPIVKDGTTAEEFGAFKLQNWRYPARDAVDSAPESDTSSTQLEPRTTAHQTMLRPKIETWVSSLPDPKDGRHNPSCQTNSVSSPDEVAEHPTASRASSDDSYNLPRNLGRSQVGKHDPFQHLLGEFRRVSTQPSPRPGGDQSHNLDPHAPLSDKTQEPRLVQDYENDTRSFHMTMRQKAGSLTLPNNVFPEFDPNMMMSINESLASLMTPLRMWPGIIDIGVELGRFYFLNVKKSHIQNPGDDDDEKHYKLSRIQSELNKRHISNEKLCFTRVLTSLGADANYIAHIRDRNGNQMWKRPTNGRSSTYEFTCRSKTVEGAEFNFIVDIDATNFTSKVKQFKPDQNCFAVHCTKRVWDFRLVLSISQDLNDICGRFAEDLSRSLRVMPKNDRIPELDVSYDKSYDIEVLAVRTRNRACCISEMNTINKCAAATDPLKDVQRLYISEVWEMDRLNKTENEQRIRLKFARYKSNNERSGMPLVWYEAALKSDTLSRAFEQNENLELGNEVEWTVEGLLKSGAVESLIHKAADMVKNMDGVGYWNDNHQADLLRGFGKPARGQDVVDKFW
ncbi:hypothetical protein F4859DRAFT_501510 [Xylaria cf. heliscus]|nr:hypothetical protein F4859DRAFT_501510 [Xylaria cf. heliscus]